MIRSSFFKFSNKYGIGLDIGPHTVKGVTLVKGSDGYCLSKYDKQVLITEDLTDESNLEGIEDEQKVNVIKSVYKNLIIRNSGKNLTTSMGDKSVMIKQVKYPAMNEDELRASMKWELKKYIPFDINTVDVDFYIMGQDSEGGMDVLLSAVNKSSLKEHREILKKCGIASSTIDIDPLAIMNSFLFNYENEDIYSSPVIIIDIGANITSLSIYHEGKEFFFRTIPISGNNINEALQKQFDFDYFKAEDMKKSLNSINEVIESVLDNMIFEIRKSLTYYNNLTKNKMFKNIFICGGGAFLKGLCDFISERLNIQTELLDPFKKIELAAEIDDDNQFQNNASSLALAVGLALRSCNRK